MDESRLGIRSLESMSDVEALVDGDFVTAILLPQGDTHVLSYERDIDNSETFELYGNRGSFPGDQRIVGYLLGTDDEEIKFSGKSIVFKPGAISLDDGDGIDYQKRKSHLDKGPRLT